MLEKIPGKIFLLEKFPRGKNYREKNRFKGENFISQKNNFENFKKLTSQEIIH